MTLSRMHHVALGLATLVLLASMAASAAPPADDPDASPSESTVDENPRYGKFKFDTEFLLQVRMVYRSEEDDTTLQLPRARIKLEGKMKRLFSAQLEVGFGDFQVELKDAFVDVRAVGKDLQVKVGHFKRPFSRERLTGSAWVGGVDRTLIRSAFDQGRDLGVMLHNGLTDEDGFEWAFGVFTDFDIDEFDPEQGYLGVRPTLGLRLGYNMKDLDGYRETDEIRGPFRAGVGASALAFLETSDTAPGRRGWRWNLDGIAKVHGATFALALLGRSTALDGGHEAIGLHGHAAYRLAPLPELEFAARYGGLYPDDGAKRHEITGGLNVYLFRSHLMLMADAGVLLDTIDGRDIEDFRFRLQIQVR